MNRLLWFLFGSVRCAWCKAEKKQARLPIKRWEIVSHGICERCKDALLKP